MSFSNLHQVIKLYTGSIRLPPFSQFGTKYCCLTYYSDRALLVTSRSHFVLIRLFLLEPLDDKTLMEPASSSCQLHKTGSP